MKRSKLIEIVENKKFNQAKEIVKKFLEDAEIANPRDDFSYYLPVDYLGYEILREEGPDAFCNYWLELIKLYEEKLEPIWGHLHKGHFLYRLGVGKFAVNIDEAKKYLEIALKEEDIAIKEYQKAFNLEVSFEKSIAKYPDYALLVLIDIIGDSFFESVDEKNRFYKGLTYQNWDSIYTPHPTDPDLVFKAIRKITPPKGFEKVIKVYNELETSYNLKLPVAILALGKYFIEILLFNIYCYKYKITNIDNKTLLEVDLNVLLKEGIKKGIFPDVAVSSLFYLFYILSRKMFKINGEVNGRIINERLNINIAICIKLLLDAVLVKWSDNSF